MKQVPFWTCGVRLFKTITMNNNLSRGLLDPTPRPESRWSTIIIGRDMINRRKESTAGKAKNLRLRGKAGVQGHLPTVDWEFCVSLWGSGPGKWLVKHIGLESVSTILHWDERILAVPPWSVNVGGNSGGGASPAPARPLMGWAVFRCVCNRSPTAWLALPCC